MMSFDRGTRLIVREIRYTARSVRTKGQSLESDQKKGEFEELKILWCGIKCIPFGKGASVA